MASQPDNSMATPGGYVSAAGTNNAVALEAIARLAGAVSAEVLVYDRMDDALRLVATSSGASSDVIARPVAEAVRTRASSPFRASDASWVTVASSTQKVAWLTKLHDQASRSFFVVLGYAEDTTMARTRIGKIASDLTTLVGVLIKGDERGEVEEAAMDALNQGQCGIIAVRSDRSVIFRNEAAASHLVTGMGLQVRRGRIVAVDDRRFETALHRILDAPVARTSRQPAITMLLKRKDGARPTVVVIAPVRCETGVHHEHGAAALVYTVDPALGALHGLDALCQLHGLSGVESRLLIHLASGVTLGDAATEMRIKLETARTYLKQIFVKTGTHRQTDLVAMMTRYLKAFRGNFDFQPV